MHNLCAFKATAIFKREIQMGKTKKHSFEKGTNLAYPGQSSNKRITFRNS